MKRFGLFAVAVCLASACTANGPLVSSASATPTVMASPAATPSPSPTPTATQSPSPSPAPTPAAFVGCTNQAPGAGIVLLGRGGEFGESGFYDVTDPLHPRLLCRVLRTSANLSNSTNFEYLDPRSATETNIAIRWFVGGTETPGGKLPGWITDAAWLPTGVVGAYTVRLDSSGSCPAGAVQVWTYNQGTSELLTTYCSGIGDCICRFGLPGPVLAFSPDGQYLVEGRLSGKGSDPMAVFRIADRVRVATLPADTYNALWDRTTDRLFLIGYTTMQVWTPNGTVSNLPGAAGWSYFANLSPDGAHAVYTSYADPAQATKPRVYLYTLDSSKTTMLVDQPRSQVVFVKKNWVWYLEEVACADCPNGTKSSGKVFAMDITTGVEQQVTFQMDETVINEMYPGEFWPAS